jgi:hypothetical protein
VLANRAWAMGISEVSRLLILSDWGVGVRQDETAVGDGDGGEF